MTILPLQHETFDAILNNCQKYTKEFITQQLTYFDRDLYYWVKNDPLKRFSLIRIDERTILTTIGIIKYKRRYYYDNVKDSYVYLLDNQLKIPPHTRMSNELILKILDLAAYMSYKEVGKHLSNEFELSKFTIWKTIRDASIEAMYEDKIDREGLKIHLQIDEKYIGMTDSTNKKRYYTATIFAGKRKINKTSHQLLNKTVLSSYDIVKLKKLINYHLKERYKVSQDEEIFVSGDLAKYIQHMNEHITVCECKYVPDKFHVYKSLRDLLPDVHVDDVSLTDVKFRRYLRERLLGIDDLEARKMARLLKYHSTSFKSYLDDEYLGCSQEGQNSHIYSPRFGKYANRFSPATLEKLSLILEAESMNVNIKIGSLTREIPDQVDIGHFQINIEDPIKEFLNTSTMRDETRKMFNEIKYGRY